MDTISYEDLSNIYFRLRNSNSIKYSTTDYFEKIERLIRRFEGCVKDDAWDDPDSSKASLEQSRWHIFHAIVCGNERNIEIWSSTPPTEAGWYKTRGRLRICVEAVEIAGDIWPSKHQGIDWKDFEGCEFSRINWTVETAQPNPLGI